MALLATMMTKFGDCADLYIPVGAIDMLQLPQRLSCANPVAQISTLHVSASLRFFNSVPLSLGRSEKPWYNL
jgi:hypothetical protein